jgi:hypothetical protein|tara:strand:- start:22 stop:411 length:390 start_codon:yes stop_codon:yes gene_type:complete
VRKNIAIYTVLGGLLLVVHSFFVIQFPERGLEHYFVVGQVFLLLLFLLGHISTVLLSSNFDIYLGQVFLGFSVFKFILTGLFILFLSKMGEFPLSKSYVLLFMFSYFIYLIVEVYILVGKLNDNENLST